MKREEIDSKTWSLYSLEKKNLYFKEIGARFSYDFYSRIKKSIKQGPDRKKIRHNGSIKGNPSFNALSILHIFEKCNYKCHYCGMMQEEHQELMGGRLTIDRIDSNTDYSVDNCVLACYVCNQIKGNILNEEEMKTIGPILYKAIKRKQAEYDDTQFNFYISIAFIANQKPLKQGGKDGIPKIAFSKPKNLISENTA